MSNKLVICSSPIDDDYVGEKYDANFTNIVECNWSDITKNASNYSEVICVNNSTDDKSAWRLLTFSRLNNFPYMNLDDTFSLKSSFHTDSTANKKIESNHILFLGCSHTQGIGHISNETVYTYKLCKLLDKNPLIIKKWPSGTGNWHIEEQLQTYNLKNSTVVVQFTDIYRIGLNGKNKYGYYYSRAESEVLSDEVLACEFLRSVKRIVNYLRANSTKFVFFQITHENRLHDEITSELSTYKEFVYMTEFLDYAEDNSHFGNKTNDYWATECYKKLTSLYSLS